jgi:hypothetical protein
MISGAVHAAVGLINWTELAFCSEATPMDQPAFYAWLDGTTMEIVELRRSGGLYDPSEDRLRLVNTHLQPLDNPTIDQRMQRYANSMEGEVRLVRAVAVETIRIIRPNGPREYEILGE